MLAALLLLALDVPLAEGDAPPPAPPEVEAPPAVEAPPEAAPPKDEAASVRLDGDKLLLPEEIIFEFDSPRIRPRSFATLDALAAFLLAQPELTRVEIAVHNDGRDVTMYSLVLTDRRARAIAEALIERGVPQERLDPIGYEHTQPIADPKTEEGRAKNRRIELWVRERAP